MKTILFASILFLLPWALSAQTGFSCQSPVTLSQVVGCSASAQYNNTNVAQNGVTWFKFTAQFAAVTLTVSGAGTSGTLVSPTTSLYTNCSGTMLQVITSITDNVTTTHYEGLTIGATYYAAVSGQNNGTFKICINNYNIPTSDGEDCATALFIENTADIHTSNFIGAGLNKNEAAGTCLDGSESNSTWFKWKAANSGTLVFTLTPDKTDNDLDFALYDLDVSGDCSNVKAANAIRCAAGSGVQCATGPQYYKTGLAFGVQDISEAGGCNLGQDGLVKYVDMIQGHNYGLLINNFSSNSGFGITFKDINGTPGTGLFAEPSSIISYKTAACNVDRTYTFSNYETTRKQFHWDFGSGATVTDADAGGNFTVVYSAGGTKIVKLIITNSAGNTSVNTLSLDVPDNQTPLPPQIMADKAAYCPGDTINLSTPAMQPYTYSWTLGNGTKLSGANVSVPIDAAYVKGSIMLTASNGACTSSSSSYTPVIGTKAAAAFSLNPKTGVEIDIPATVSFTNTSANADNYLWNFGDGQTSTDVNPVHIYKSRGNYQVTLTAYNSMGCHSSITQGDLTVRYGNVFLIPNTFTPNADNVNDKFTVSITNLLTYHIYIFNRLGKQVFESNDTLKSWDGFYQGKAVAVGTYYYLIEATGLDRNDIRKSGYVALVR